jgi:predicted metalloprotease
LPSNNKGIFTEPFPCNDKGNIHIDTYWWEGFFNKAIEMGSGAVIYVPSFMKIGSGIQKLIGRDTQITHTDSNVIS